MNHVNPFVNIIVSMITEKLSQNKAEVFFEIVIIQNTRRVLSYFILQIKRLF